MDEKLSPELQKKLEQHVVNSAIRQNMELLITLSSDCFEQCVHTFPSKLMDKTETSCVEHCADRYIALSQRVGQEYQKIQMNKVILARMKGSSN
mmetsp:Transcript_5604/g.8142  ORF Transcript_5604/g.8142 Transcript_5604/m.8142 type:complete len:94 (-) Transcript_5604:1017-1298(-)